MAPVMRRVMEMTRLKVRKMIKQVEIAVKMMKRLKLCLLALVSIATSCFQPQGTKKIIKTICTRKIPSPKSHTQFDAEDDGHIKLGQAAIHQLL